MNRTRVVPLSRFALALLCLLLVGCTRGGESTPPPSDFPGEGAIPVPTFTPSLGELPAPSSDFDLPGQLPGSEGAFPTTTPEGVPPPPVQELPTSAPIAAGETRFSNLRFATSGSGAAQSNFPTGTEQVCALWDYRDMQPTDSVRRTWKLNGATYVERQEAWDSGKYPSPGTVSDVCLYDRIDGYIDGAMDGVDAGTWTVELAINGQPAITGQFVVGGP